MGQAQEGKKGGGANAVHPRLGTEALCPAVGYACAAAVVVGLLRAFLFIKKYRTKRNPGTENRTGFRPCRGMAAVVFFSGVLV